MVPVFLLCDVISMACLRFSFRCFQSSNEEGMPSFLLRFSGASLCVFDPILFFFVPASVAVLILTDVCICSPLSLHLCQLHFFLYFVICVAYFFDLAILRWISACEVQGANEKSDPPKAARTAIASGRRPASGEVVICFAYFAIGFVFPHLNDEPEHLALKSSCNCCVPG